MKNELQIFNNPSFGEIRTLHEDGKALFCGKDVAAALGYKDTTSAMKQHCRGVVKRHLTDALGRRQETNFISVGDVYRLAAKSELPGAEAFESWIFDEVVPSVCSTGSYVAPSNRPALAEVNETARIVLPVLEAAGMAPPMRALVIKNLYAPAGVDIPIDGVTMEKQFYDATTIAQKLGMLSVSGKPHGQAAAAIIAMLGVDSREVQIVPFQNQSSGHSGTTTQYAESVLGRVRGWIESHRYPPEISVGSRTYKVKYQLISA